METEENFCSFTSTYQCKTELENDLLGNLKNLHCHFNWKYDEPKISNSTRTLQERTAILRGKKNYKTNEIQIKVNQICYFCREMQLAFYETVTGNLEVTADCFTVATNIADSVTETHIKRSMLYVLECNKLFTLFLLGEYAECLERVNLLQQEFGSFGVLERTAVMGIYAISLMDSGIEGCLKSVDLFRKICIMDPKTFEWPLRLGIALMRIREDTDPLQMPSTEESKNFRSAVTLASIPNGHFSTRPEMYNIKSSFQAGRPGEDLKSVMANAFKILAIAQSRGSDSETTIKFLEAVLYYPDLSKDNSILQILERILKENNNNFIVNFIAGVYFKKHAKDFTRALYHFEKAGQMDLKSYKFHLEMHLIDLRFHFNNQNLNTAISSLTVLHEKCESYPEKQRMILCLRGVLHLFEPENTNFAVVDWINALAKDRERYQITLLNTLLNSAAILGNRRNALSIFIRMFHIMANTCDTFQTNNIFNIFFKELVLIFGAFKDIVPFEQYELDEELMKADAQRDKITTQNNDIRKSNPIAKNPWQIESDTSSFDQQDVPNTNHFAPENRLNMSQFYQQDMSYVRQIDQQILSNTSQFDQQMNMPNTSQFNQQMYMPNTSQFNQQNIQTTSTNLVQNIPLNRPIASSDTIRRRFPNRENGNLKFDRTLIRGSNRTVAVNITKEDLESKNIDIHLYM